MAMALISSSALLQAPVFIFVLVSSYGIHQLADASAVLDLPIGFSQSLNSLIKQTNYCVAAYPPDSANDRIFVPFLSSENFITTVNATQSYGFAFGMYFQSGGTAFLAICGGFSGDIKSAGKPRDYMLQNDTNSGNRGAYRGVNQTPDGYAVPTWKLHPEVNNSGASLVVVPGGVSGKPQLQLRDGDNRTVLWNVTDVGMMEMLDDGTLVIYDSDTESSNYNTTGVKSRVVTWQSTVNGSDVLIGRQKLMLNQQLQSNNSAYSALVQNDGLALRMNSIQRHDPTYTFISFNSTGSNCTSAETHISFLSAAGDVTSSTEFAHYTPLLLGLSCPTTGGERRIFALDANQTLSSFNFTFLNLANDGRLYIVAISIANDYNPQINQFQLKQGIYESGSSISSSQLAQIADLPGCEVPLACGYMSRCTPGANTRCICPNFANIAFRPINESDLSQGCSRVTPLPDCTTPSALYQVSFMQVNNTASIFLFSLSPSFNFDLVSTNPYECRSNCTANCMCQGYIQYDSHTHHSCYLILENIGSLLTLDGNYPYPYPYQGNFSTFFKLANTNSNNSNNQIDSHVLGGIIGGFIVVFIIVLGSFIYWRRRKKYKLRHQQMLEEGELQRIIPSMITRFTYRDLHKATDNFKVLLGVGGCGSVYKGSLANGRVVAVKIIGTSNSLGRQKTKQFLTEVACVSRTSHQNIVRLFGFCWENSQLLLVYEYMEKQSLDKWLFHVEKKHFLDWKTRFRMAIGIARGLHYLHEECAEPILHFDIKSQNILLDDDFAPKLSDFGLSKLMSENDTSNVVTIVRGTPGYIAPEWLSQGIVNKKADVYSMGMVFLELVSGRKVLDFSFLTNDLQPSSHGEWHLPSWAAMKCEQGLLYEIVDIDIRGALNDEELKRLIFTSFWCIIEDPFMRPSVGMVLQWLNDSSPIAPPNFSLVKVNAQSQIKHSLCSSQLTSSCSIVIPR